MSKYNVLEFLRVKSWLKMACALVLVVMAAFALDYSSAHEGYQTIDSAAIASVDATLTRTTELFIIAKGVNSVLSVAKTLQLSFSLGGGGAITAGAILDPLDQLIDDFSDWLLEGAAAVAVVKICLMGIQQIGFVAFAFLLIPLIVTASYLRRKADGKDRLIYRICVPAIAIMLFLRIGVPVAFITLDPVSHGILDKPYASAIKEIKSFSLSLSDDEALSIEVVGKVKSAARAIATNARPFFNSLATIVAIMVAQILIFPLMLTWMCWRFCRWCINYV